MRFISGQNVWDCDLLGDVIPIEEAAASSMAFMTYYFSCVCAVLLLRIHRLVHSCMK